MSEAKINEELEKYYIQAIVVSTYFDYDDYEQPIKTYVNDIDFMNILVNYTNIFAVRVQQNQAYLADNLFYNSEFKKLTYYNAGKKEFRYENLGLNEGMIMRVYVNLDRELVSFERNVYSFLDMFGFLGGLFDFMYFTGFLFINFFTKNIYFNDILSKLYQVQEHKDNRKAVYCNKIPSDSSVFQSRLDNESYKNINTSQVHSEVDMVKDNEDSHQYLEKFKEELKSRRRYTYQTCDCLK